MENIISQATAFSPNFLMSEEAILVYMRILQTAAYVIVGYFLILLLVRFTNRHVKDLKARHTIRKNIVYVFSLLIILVVIAFWAHKISSITIFLGVASAGVALALQEALLSVAGWFLIVFRHPYEVGDRIELNGVKGDVIDIRLFQTSLLEIGNWVEADQSTGRIANIPNSAVFKKENFNYSRGFEFIWNEIKVLITFESDWKKAEEIMLTRGRDLVGDMEKEVKNKIDKMTQHYMIYYDKLTPIVYTNIKDSGVEMSLRYLTEAKTRRSTHDKLCREIMEDFGKEPSVNFAYTTYRIIK